MSVGPLGMASGLAGTTQSRGNETERSQQDDSVQQRQAKFEKQAESAAGVGETTEDQESGDRDADGRRLCEESAEKESQEGTLEVGTDPTPSKDATGERGTQLDLSG